MNTADHPSLAQFAFSGRELALLFDAALDSVVGMDADGIVTAWNRQAELLFGWQRDEAIGRELAELIIPAGYRAKHHAGMAHYLATGEGPVLNRRIEVSAITRDGTEFPVELSIIPVEAAGRPHFYGFLRDISLQKTLEAQAASDQARDKMLFEISQLAAETGEFRLLLRRSIELICKFTGSACGHIYLPDPAANPAVMRATEIWHVQSDAFAAVRTHAEASALKRGEGLPGEIWQKKEAIWIEDLSSHTGFLRSTEYEKIGLKSGFGFPVLHGDEPLAILEFFSAERRAPDPTLLSAITWIGSHLGRVIERHRAHEQAHLLARELSHRVGNLMSVVSAIFQRSIRYSASVDELGEKFGERLQALKRAQSRLSETDWDGASIQQLAEDVLAPYCSTGDGNCRFSGEPVAIGSSLSMTLSLVFHELAVNAAKYGALSVSEGKLDLSWSVEASGAAPMIVFLWRERGGPAVSAPQRRGFGSELISRLVEKSLRGRVEIDYDPAGLCVTMQVPL